MSDLPIVKRLREGQRYTNVLDGEMMKDAAYTIEALVAALEEVERWWLVEGQHVHLGAPYAIFAAHDALAKAIGED